jgi:hypothetical protein
MTVERFSKDTVSTKLLIALTASLIIGFIIWWITSCVNERYLQDDPMLFKLKDIVKPLHPDIQNLKLYKGKKSYTINKDKIYLCLRDENDEYYPENTLIYVLLHEISHFLNKDDIGHTEKFHQIFENLIEKAHNMGIYNASIPPIENYCMHNPDE